MSDISPQTYELLASERSKHDTLSRSSMEKAICETHFSSMVLGLRNVGGVKCQPFLKHSNHWKRSLKIIFKESGCFKFPETVVTSTQKESLRTTESGSIQVLAVL